MDAIKKAIWGEGAPQNMNEEPVSGLQGKGTIDEPFDKGNEDIKSTTTDDGPSNAQSETGDPSSGQKSTQKQQGADRPQDEPKKGEVRMPHTDEEREELMMKGEFPHDPNDHSGEPLHMHDDSENKGKGKDRRDSVSNEGGNRLGKPTGTGEQYVKSSGLAAEGGDFDASNPGAGVEANRLLEEHGVRKSTDKASSSSQVDSSPAGSEKQGKPSKMSKLREKLHIKKK